MSKSIVVDYFFKILLKCLFKCFTFKAIPKDKRLALADNINDDKDNWLYDDQEDDYHGGTQRGFCDTIWDCLSDGASTGCEIGGEILGIPGKIVGGVIGGAVGIVKGIFCGIFGWFELLWWLR